MVREDLIFAKEGIGSKEEGLAFLTKAAGAAGLLESEEAFLQAVYRREEEISTAIGYGIAIPHGKTDAVKEAFIAFMTTAEKLVWDGEQVEAIFLIGVPAGKADTLHLKAIAAISKKLIHDEFRQNLLHCGTKQEAFKLLSEIDKGIQ